MSNTADFIIVGGGTACLLLANCLVSTPSKPSVLVIEAGPDRSDKKYRNPAQRYMLAFTNPELDHGYSTVPQVGLGGRKLRYMRGKGLGGSTLTNFMIFASGSKDDYNYWAELVGDDTWKWENTKRRLKELESFDLTVPEGYDHVAKPNPEAHGQNGPVKIGFPSSFELGTKEIIEEAAKHGIPINLDPNSGNPIGMGLPPVAAAKGYRTTSASANLQNKPDNLTIWASSPVAKILFSGTRATGVQLIDGRIAHATKEVILTAGSFETPKLLMLSGIGPVSELKKHYIPLLKDLPGIGKSLSDHATIFITALMKPNHFSTRTAFLASPTYNDSLSQWENNGTGRMTTESQSLAIQFSKLPGLYSTPEFLALDAKTQEYLKRDTVPHYEATFGGPLFPPNAVVPEGYEYLNIGIFGMNPQSHGTVSLSSSNPIHTHPFDRRVMLEAFKEVLEFFKKTKQYKMGFVRWLNDMNDPLEKLLEDQELAVWHANGTVKMGRGGERGTCVDANFRVVGMEGLRVADLSVCPVTINGHTQAAAYLVGTTAAEKLIGEYQL